MHRHRHGVEHGLALLRAAVAEVLLGPPPAPAAVAPAAVVSRPGDRHTGHVLWTETTDVHAAAPSQGEAGGHGDHDQAISSELDEGEQRRLIALVELARDGDKEAFGLLFDHYHTSVYRFLFYRTRSQQLAEDLTSETFFRALRSMNNFRWQGRDFGAWLMTIARNLTTDHFKAGRTRLETVTEDMSSHDEPGDEGPEDAVMSSLTNEVLMQALTELPAEQQECLVLRFLQGFSIAETAKSLGRSDGAIKQLQLRAVRNVAKLMPEGLRDA